MAAPPPPSRAAPWIQALCIVAMVAVVWIDANTVDFEAPFFVYGGFTGIALGLSSDALASIFKR